MPFLHCFVAKTVYTAPVDDVDFKRIDNFDPCPTPPTWPSRSQPAIRDEIDAGEWVPKKLENGKWACNHRCKDKTAYEIIV